MVQFPIHSVDLRQVISTLCLFFSICKIGNALTFICPAEPAEGSLTNQQHTDRGVKHNCWITTISIGMDLAINHIPVYYLCALRHHSAQRYLRSTFQPGCWLPGLQLLGWKVRQVKCWSSLLLLKEGSGQLQSASTPFPTLPAAVQQRYGW